MSDQIVWCRVWTVEDRDSPVTLKLCSLHATRTLETLFRTEYRKHLPESAVPDTFCFATPKLYRCKVGDTIADRVVNSDFGLWCVTIPSESLDATSLIQQDDLMSLVEGQMPATKKFQSE